MEIDHEIFLPPFSSRLLIQDGFLTVTREVLVKHLVKHAQEESVVR